MEVKPFDAIVYNQEIVDIKDVTAPPYDVISAEQQKELYEKSPYNIVRLILARGDERYKDAARDFSTWLNKNILVKMPKPCIFYIVQKYTTQGGKHIERKGFIAKNKIEKFESKKVLPHEFTMGGPKEDRLKLMQAADANFSQIFMVYSDPTKLIENKIGKNLAKTKPFIDVTDDKGVQNLVWVIDNKEDIQTIENLMQDKVLLIADGHHRYESAMNYSEISKNPEAQYVMSYFTNLDDENLVIFPTHRIITRQIEPYILIEAVRKYFDVEEISFNSYNKKQAKENFLAKIEKENKKQIAMGLYMKNVNKFYVLKLKKEAKGCVDAPDVLKKLDLTILHELIITQEMGFTKEEQMAQDGIKYVKQELEAFDMIDNGKAEASFIMAYPKMQDIKDISSGGYKMPQKSTYFYPKLLSGIAINPLKTL